MKRPRYILQLHVKISDSGTNIVRLPIGDFQITEALKLRCAAIAYVTRCKTVIQDLESETHALGKTVYEVVP